MKFAAATLAATIAIASAGDFYWKHNSEWSNNDNWDKSPEANTYVGIGVYDSAGSVEECSNMDAAINLTPDASVETGGILFAPGVTIELGVNAEIVLNLAESDDVVQWKCKSDVDVDYRCSANWQDENGAPVGSVPCIADNIYFPAATVGVVKNTDSPVVGMVSIDGEKIQAPREIEAISENYAGFSNSFFPESTLDDPATTMAAELSCYDSCPELDEVTSDAEKYAAAHDHLEKRQEFLSGMLTELGGRYAVNPARKVSPALQAKMAGRHTMYIFKGAEGKPMPTVRMNTDPSESVDFLDEVEGQVKNHFKDQQGSNGCLNTNQEAFSWHPTSCAPLAGFPGDKVNACEEGGDNQFDDACPSTKRTVCPDPAHINVATRVALSGHSATCGEFNDDIGLWYALPATARTQVTNNCCEANENVVVVGCGFQTEGLQDDVTFDLFSGSLVQVTKELLHGASRGSRDASTGKCSTAYIATDIADKYLPINLGAATGEFLAAGDNEDIDQAVVVGALATHGMAAALTDYDLGDKEDDFDMKFHVKKFQGVNPDGRRQRRSFKDVKNDVERKMQTELPYTGLEFDDIVEGSKVPGYGSQLLIEGLSVKWFETDALAAIDPAVVEPFVSNILFTFAMEAQEYALKKAEYEFLTTSTTTTVTYPPVVKVTEPPTVEPEASGTLELLGDGTIERNGKPIATIVSQMGNIKEVFDIKAAYETAAVTAIQTELDELEADKKSKTETYVTMKEALDACDRAGVDKPFTVSYPDGCNDEKAAFDAASNDFERFLEGSEGMDYAATVDNLFRKKGESLADLTELQAEYKEDLLDLVEYNPEVHGNSALTNSYKSPTEMKDIQTNFQQVDDELDSLASQVQDTLRMLGGEASGSDSAMAVEVSELKSQEKKLQDSADECKETEAKRLSDVPAPVLEVGSTFYETELKLKESTMTSTCSAFEADLANTKALLEGNTAKYESLKEKTDEAFVQTQAAVDELDEFDTTGSALLLASVNSRVEEDEKGLPIVIIAAAGGGGLLLIIIIVVAVSSGKSNNNNGGGYSGSWGDQGSSVVAFENPVYAGDDGYGAEGEGAYDDGYAEDDGGGLYDEPEMFQDNDNDNGAGGGYLDVAPDDDDEEGDDDEEDDEEEESGEDEESEEDDDEDDDEDDEEDDDDDDDDDDEDDSDDE
jgi:hypothetical protein